MGREIWEQRESIMRRALVQKDHGDTNEAHTRKTPQVTIRNIQNAPVPEPLAKDGTKTKVKGYTMLQDDRMKDARLTIRPVSDGRELNDRYGLITGIPRTPRAIYADALTHFSP